MRRSSINIRTLSLALGITMATLAALLVWRSFSNLIESPIFVVKNSDIWFDSDIFRTISTMFNTETAGTKSNLHPVFAIIFYWLIGVVSFLVSSPIVAVKSLMALNAFLATILLWRLLNWLRLDLIDVFLSLSLFISSASFVFWFTTVETFPIGATSMLLSLQIFTVPQTRGLRLFVLQIILCGASLAITISNWVVGLTAVALRFDFPKLVGRLFKAPNHGVLKKDWVPFSYPIKVVVSSGFLILTLAIIQNSIFTSGNLFLRIDKVRSESKFIELRGLQNFGIRIIELIVNPVVVGEIIAVNYPVTLDQSGWAFDEIYTDKFISSENKKILTTNVLSFSSAAHCLAVLAWLSILARSVKKIYSSRLVDPIVSTSIVTLAVFIVMHSVYGFCTFLYASHFVLFYVIVSSVSLQSDRRWLSRFLMTTLIGCGGYHNYNSFELAKEMLFTISG
jgi:hypothetical protein